MSEQSWNGYKVGDLVVITSSLHPIVSCGDVVTIIDDALNDEESVRCRTSDGDTTFVGFEKFEHYTESNSEPEQITETLTQEKQVKQLNEYKVGDKAVLISYRGVGFNVGEVVCRVACHSDDGFSVGFALVSKPSGQYVYCDLGDIEEYVEPKNTQPEVEYSVPVAEETEQIQVELPKSNLRAILQAHIDNKETFMKSELVQDKIIVTSDLVLVRIKEFCAKYEFSAILWCCEGWSISTNAYTKRNLTDLQLLEHLDAYNILFGE